MIKRAYRRTAAVTAMTLAFATTSGFEGNGRREGFTTIESAAGAIAAFQAAHPENIIDADWVSLGAPGSCRVSMFGNVALGICSAQNKGKVASVVLAATQTGDVAPEQISIVVAGSVLSDTRSGAIDMNGTGTFEAFHQNSAPHRISTAQALLQLQTVYNAAVAQQ